MQKLVSNSSSQLPWENCLFETKTLICLWVEVPTGRKQLSAIFSFSPVSLLKSTIYFIRFPQLNSTGMELATYS